MSSSDSSSSPSTISVVIGTALLAATAGYLFGTASSLGLTRGSQEPDDAKPSQKGKKAAKSWPNNYDVTIHPDSSDEELMQKLKGGNNADAETAPESENDSDAGAGDGELRAFEGIQDECKLVLVVRTDLGMSKGKIAAQCSHATLACYTHLQAYPEAGRSLLKRWQSRGQAKVAVACKNEEELLTLQAQALSLGLCARIIHDAGRTQIAAGSATVLGVGPGPKGVVDMVTGSLKLL